MSVWLFKSVEETDTSYTDILLKNGFQPYIIPTLTFNYVNQMALETALNQPSAYRGMIFTSPRAVHAIYNVYNRLQISIQREWQDKKIFAVGNATSMLVQSKLRLHSIGSNSGNAYELAQVITKEIRPYEKPLLFPCGNIKRDELPRVLAGKDIDFSAVTCYETKGHPDLKCTMKSMLHTKADFLVFFSPSGVHNVLPLFCELKMETCNSKVIALGPSTNAALAENKIPVFSICTSSPEGLLHSLKSP